MTHAWAVMIVLCVSAVLFYAGVFEATGRPRFEGLDALALRPVPEQVKLYSDGVVVLTVLNTRPYSVTMDFVDVAPIMDREDVVRTDLNVMIKPAEFGVLRLNGSNLVPGIMGASMFFIPWVDAAPTTTSTYSVNPSQPSMAGNVDFHICLTESFSVGGSSKTHTVCGTAWRIEVHTEPYYSSVTTLPGCNWSISGSDCMCPCTSDSDCLTCQYCYIGLPMSEPSSCSDTCMDYCLSAVGPGYFCRWTGVDNLGECVLV